MSNFSPKLQESNEEKLWNLINDSSPNYGSLASDELTRRALSSLRDSIKVFNKQLSEQTKKLIKLTWWIVGLTIVMVTGLILQIILTL